MKSRMLALILALTVVSWAQTATQSTPSAAQQGTTGNAKHACCDKMSDAKGGHAACARNHDGKEMASCCAGKDEKSCCGKDAKSCMRDSKTSASSGKDCCGKEKDKTASCCAGNEGKECHKGCCGGDKSEKQS